jgi:hypothetical protein
VGSAVDEVDLDLDLVQAEAVGEEDLVVPDVVDAVLPLGLDAARVGAGQVDLQRGEHIRVLDAQVVGPELDQALGISG